MANQITPLKLEKKTELVEPSKHTPSEILSLSTLDNDPFNEAMYTTIYVYERNNRIRNDPESLLRKALSDLLVYYYPFSGKLTRRRSDWKLQLTCQGEGVPFIVATANVKLSSLSYLEDVDADTASQLMPNYNVNYESEAGYHLLALQVTKFSCGGFTIGTALSHAVCDGFGAARFIHALTELAGGKSKPTVMPTWDRERLVGKPDDQPAKIPGGDTASLLAVSPYMPTSDVVSETINISAGSIKRLKEALLKESELHKEGFTTFEVLGAYLWRSRYRALKLNPEGITVLGLAVGIRHVVDPPLPEGYYGNACIDVYIDLTGRELDESPISDIVKLIKEAKKAAYNKDYIREELGNTEKLMNMNKMFGGREDGLFFFTDWRNIGLFGSMDFGWNEPVNLLPVVPRESAKNLCMLLRPSRLDPSMEGAAKVVMTLPRAAMPKFKEQMSALNNLGDGAGGA